MSEHEAELRSTFRAFFAKEAPPDRVRAADARQPPGFDPTLWAQARALGVPEMDGASLADLAVVAAEHGRALAPIPLVEAIVAARLLARLPHRAADPVTLGTLAVQPAADGVAPLVPAGAVADAVVALDGDELVLARDGRVGDAPVNLAGAPLATWALQDRVVLARGADARTRFADAVDEWRLLTAAALVGLARRALELGVDYARGRRQFGVPIGSFQALQHRLADVRAAVDAADLLVRDAADGPDPRRMAAAFLAATRAARDAAATSLHVHGGYGFMLEYDIQLYFRRATAWPLAIGDPADELARLADLLAADDWTLLDPPPCGFRAEVRAALAEACTDDVLERVAATGTVHDWGLHRALAGRGLLGAGWPVEWGGADRDEHDVLALWEELERAGAPADGWGTTELVARTLALVGTDEQRRRVIPSFLAGDILVCLGYSEPDSGSDVAAATTRATRDGDDWVINGQKMFTTLAHEAAYVFLLTRTNTEAPKHRGLTMFLVPMDRPGIEITPVRTLSGERTNITYYSDVRVPDACRVGDVDGGWDVMRVALAFERRPTMVGELDRLLRRFLGWARGRADALERPTVRARVARGWIDLEAGRRLSERMAAVAAGGELPIVEGSVAKLWSSEALVRAAAALLDTLGAEGVLALGAPGAPADGAVELLHRHAQVTTIRAGTSEIQRTIIAERGLGLPRAGR
ncbi:MAG TPA: acyl-CoA dehydrogenase [Acidimicrobiia bacterium]|nr:acyl-CoA dehydrogenase [Acidimicrobiia bacterium]